ncbi:PKD-like family lipoprotein [Solitalea lacus]|uniref:PKD-like family lipoprotein n=1 Tax=Solitalea lacus TaxID=2911172 RepID=UPI001EDA6353|nr:PKD-like family lipoprotein [Solitalea lacus]UKJ07677.1 hypothetical protein L2B55_00585 [Solitalea lacus]
MKKRIYSYLIAASIVVASSCKKDIGNYEYHDINKVTFSEFGELGVVNAVYGKPLTIKPEVSYTMDVKGDPSRYSYEWRYVDPADRKIHVLATTKDLEFQGVPLKANSYTFFYRITDKETGVTFDKPFTLTVRNEINEGWMLMTDVNGKAQLDMLSLEVDNTFSTITDLLAKTSSGLTLKGKPLFVYGFNLTTPFVAPGINTGDYALYVGTDQETNRLEPEFFKWSSIYNAENEVYGYNFPENFHYDVIRRAGPNRSYMVSNGDLFCYDRTTNIRYSTPLNFTTSTGTLFKVAPCIAVNESDAFVSCVAFDVVNKRFVKHISPSNGTVSTFTDPPAASKKFSYNIGMDLIYMDYNTSAKEVFAILKNASNQYWLARFTPAGTQSYFDLLPATDFDKAEKIAISPDKGFIFYNVGGKVYKYDVPTKSTTTVFDKGTQKISVLKFHAFHNSTGFIKYKDGNKLIVCSYDPALPADKNGKMEMFNVPTLFTDPLTVDKTYTGFGKVVSLHYRERN